ncbi:hypothetical protein HBB16_09905 [Pseudonocardia sp. MCCB 268]|nr:hypothetical protein [Pseudonocardia cytotoxica]
MHDLDALTTDALYPHTSPALPALATGLHDLDPDARGGYDPALTVIGAQPAGAGLAVVAALRAR